MSATPHRRILIVGVGNVLHGDDGFGVAVAKRLAQEPLPPGSTLLETGIGGMSIVQELMQGYDAVLVIDAHQRGGSPGSLRLLEPVLPDLSALDAHALRDYFADTHYATPLRALALARHLGRLPACVRVIGCEPQAVEPMSLGLSAPVAAAVEPAVTMAFEWLRAARVTEDEAL